MEELGKERRLKGLQYIERKRDNIKNLKEERSDIKDGRKEVEKKWCIEDWEEKKGEYKKVNRLKRENRGGWGDEI